MTAQCNPGQSRFDLEFLAHELQIFYPWAAELPVDLLRLGGLAPELESKLVGQPMIRVAKIERRIVGVYLTVAESDTRHRLIALAVLPEERGRGIGSWLVGHALGVSETRGAREVTVSAGTPADGIFERLRFTRDADQWRMAIDPE